MDKTLRLLLVAGARPNFMKVAPLIKAIQRHNLSAEAEAGSPESGRKIDCRLVHTGQHYDEKMSEVFFRELGIPAPDVNLEVGSGSHAVQTARIMEKFEPVLLSAFAQESGEGRGERRGAHPLSPLSSPPSPPLSPQGDGRPDWLVVVGDVNSTMACTLVASKLGVKVAHIEAGLRSGDRTMPEEINRLVTDAVADLLLTPSEDASENLRREGVPEHRIRLVGNIMIDSLINNLPQARNSTLLNGLGLEKQRFVYVTLHRPSNVDHKESLAAIMGELNRLGNRFPIVFPMHPRTRKMLGECGITPGQNGTVRIIEPIGYHDSLCLTENARLVLTDSGGLQEESTYFRTPCLTLRPNTERPVTVSVGSNRLTNVGLLPTDLSEALAKSDRIGEIPPFWDGHTAERILERLLAFN